MPELLKVERYSFKKDWTLSRYYVNEALHGFGVEDELRDVKIKGETAIPFGKYKLGFRQSPKFSNTFYYNDAANKLIKADEYAALSSAEKKKWRPHDLIWVKDVPNFEYVLIHWGNTDDDTEGCYIVGNKVGVVSGQEGVLESRVNYMKLYPKIYPLIKNGEHYINYTK
jgi:hypothetical protein